MSSKRPIRRAARIHAVAMALYMLLPLWQAAEAADGACSAAHGRTTINEIYQKPPGTDNYIEIKMLDASIAASTYGQWTVTSCAFNGCQTQRLEDFQNAHPYLTATFAANRINLRESMSVTLRDADGHVIDYVRLGNHDAAPSCTPAYDWDVTSWDTNTHNIQRKPDGTGNWKSNAGGSGQDSAGTGNDVGDPKKARWIVSADAAAVRGQPVTFTLRHVDQNGVEVQPTDNPVTIEYQTMDDSAVAGVDYTPHPQGSTQTISTTESRVTIDVDTLPRSTSQELVFQLFLVSAENASIENHFYNGTIRPSDYLHHLELEFSANGLTCQGEAVTVRACGDASCSTLYSGDVSVTFEPSGAWSGGDVHTINGTGTVHARKRAPGVLSIPEPTSDPAPAEPYICYKGDGTNDCSIDFHESGFLIQHAAAPACGRDTAVTVQAVRSDAHGETCTAHDGFANVSREVSFWSEYLTPNSGTRRLHLDGTAVATAAPGTPLTIAFDANARASLTASYADAGELGIRAYYQGSAANGDDGLEMRAIDTGPLRSVPARVDLRASTDGSTLLNTVTAGGTPYWKAGAPFQLQVQAQCDNGDIARNYRPALAELKAAPEAPAGGHAGSLRMRGQTITDSWLDVSALFSEGVVVEPSQDPADPTAYVSADYSEVGAFRLAFRDQAYLGVGTPTAEVAIGRFTPARFEITDNTPGLRNGPDAGWSCGFSYLGQPVGYETAPVFTIRPLNARSEVIRNYAGDSWRLKPAADPWLIGRSYTDASGNGLTTAIDTMGSTTLSGHDDFATHATLVVTGERVRYQKPVQAQLPFAAAVRLTLPQAEFTDSDGVCYEDPAGACANYLTSAITGTELRYGRLRLDGAYGPETEPLVLPMIAEHWQSIAGTQAFGANGPDSCTVVSNTDIQLTNFQPELDAGETTPTVSAISSGKGSVQLSAPGEGNHGQVTVITDGPAWLYWDWDGDGSSEAPAADAIFGIYPGSERVIYRREVY